MTKIKTDDLRTTKNTFENISIGSMFTEPECSTPYLKVDIFKLVLPCKEDISPIEDSDYTYNAITLDGEPYWFDEDDEVDPIDEISITMK